jgi:probable rRNA maturation factor
MSVIIDLHNASGDVAIPLRKQFKHWATAAMSTIAPERKRVQLSIRIVDATESAELNSHYRHKQGPTNILSFPVPPQLHKAPLLGDLAICAEVVAREAGAQHKTLDAHWAHLTVHGVLHLCDYDHEEDEAALKMENLERKILAELGYNDPYQETTSIRP